MIKINIAVDKYKIETCTITDEECEEYGCNTCSRAIEKEQNESDMEEKRIYTFKPRTQHGVTCEVNYDNTALRCASIVDAIQYVGLRIEPYTKIIGLLDQEVIDKEHPVLNIIRTHINLSPCTCSYYRQQYPLITVHGDVVIVTAPKIEEYNYE